MPASRKETLEIILEGLAGWLEYDDKQAWAREEAEALEEMLMSLRLCSSMGPRPRAWMEHRTQL